MMRNLRRRALGVVAAFVATVLVAAGCGLGDESSGSAEGSLVVALPTEPDTLNPLVQNYSPSSESIFRNVYETLYVIDADGELVPLLAEEMPVSVDATTWEITLRDGVTFHRGEDFNATVAAAVINETITNEDLRLDSLVTPFWSPVWKEATAVDDVTLRVTTTQPDPTFIQHLNWIPMVPDSVLGTNELDQSENGTGPYVLDEWNKGQDVTLTRNDDYWGEPGKFTSVTMRFVPESGSRVASLLAGDVDVTVDIPLEDAERVPKSNLMGPESAGMLVLDPNDGPTADPEVREAISLAIDREALSSTLGDAAEPLTIAAASTQIDGRTADALPYEPEEASRLRESAGAKRITLVGSTGRWPRDEQITQAIASYLEGAGFEVDLQLKPYEAYLDTLFGKDTGGRADAILVFPGYAIDPSKLAQTWLAPGGPLVSNTDPELGTMIDKAAVTTDPDERIDAYFDIYEYNNEQNYVVPIMSTLIRNGMQDNIDWEAGANVPFMKLSDVSS